MAKVTQYVVQPFERNKRGYVVAAQPWPATDAEHARRLATRLAVQKGGAVAFSRAGDPGIGEYDDAEILGVFGSVPREALEAAA